MEPRAVIAASHERHVADRVQVGEDADAVHDSHRRGRRVLELRQAHRAGQLQMPGPFRDARQVVGVGFVRRQDETRRGNLGEQVDERGEHDRLVARPGGARHDGERPGGRGGEPRERLARPVEALGALRDAVVARVARHFDHVAPRAQLPEPPAVVLADRPHAIERAVGGLRPAARGPAQPRALERHGRRNQPQLHAAAPRGERELGPHVELREHQRRGLQRFQDGRDVGGAVEREVVHQVHGEGAGESLGRGREVGVDELPLRPLSPKTLQHGLRLQALAHRGGVHPDERSPGVALGLPPGGEPLQYATARVQAAGDLLVEPGGKRQRPLGQPHAQPIYEGRAVPHHRVRRGGAVLLR